MGGASSVEWRNSKERPGVHLRVHMGGGLQGAGDHGVNNEGECSRWQSAVAPRKS